MQVVLIEKRERKLPFEFEKGGRDHETDGHPIM
jgi:hypothetical protein